MDALILEVATRGLHRYHRVDKPVTRVGRALDNDIILSDPTVAPHHFEIRHGEDESLEIVNLTEINPTRVGGERIESRVDPGLPARLEIGRVHATLMASDQAVAATRPLAGGGRGSHLFGHASWAVALVLACLLLGALSFYFNAYNSFKASDLLKYLLRETVLTLGGFVMALAVLERLLVNRWEIKQLITSVSLVYLLYGFTAFLAEWLQYLFSADWPATLLFFGWFLLILPGAVMLYLVNITHLRPARSLMLAILIAGPIALPSMLRSPVTQSLLDDFSPVAHYQNNLSSFNLHLLDTVSIDEFIEQAQRLEAGEFAD